MEKREISVPQQLFVDALLDGHSQSEAARRAGYSEAAANTVIKGVAVNKKLCGHAREIVRGKIDIQGAPAGYRVLMRLLHEDDTPRNLKVDIAKFLINHSVPAPKALEEGGERDKEPHEMSDEELQELIRRTDDELRDRGKLIDATPSYAVDDLI